MQRAGNGITTEAIDGSAVMPTQGIDPDIIDRYPHIREEYTYANTETIDRFVDAYLESIITSRCNAASQYIGEMLDPTGKPEERVTHYAIDHPGLTPEWRQLVAESASLYYRMRAIQTASDTSARIQCTEDREPGDTDLG